jgi:hypothetical protein
MEGIFAPPSMVARPIVCSDITGKRGSELVYQSQRIG